MRFEELQRENEEIQREYEALRKRMEVFRSKPDLEGAEVERVRRLELREIERAADRLESRSADFKAKLREHRYEDEPAPLGWMARRSWWSGALIGMVVTVALCVAFAVQRGPVEAGFFDASAQVIPVLALALAIEARLFEIDTFQRVRFMGGYYAVVFLWIVVGEIAALAVLAQGHPTALAFGLVGASLASAGLAFVLVALIGRPRHP